MEEMEDGICLDTDFLVNFLRNMGWNYDEIQKTLLEWNKKNYEPLREGYILSQVSWHKRQNHNLLPPNCTNESYYKTLGICKPDNWCTRIKNPAQYPKYKIKVHEQNNRKQKRKQKE